MSTYGSGVGIIFVCSMFDVACMPSIAFCMHAIGLLSMAELEVIFSQLCVSMDWLASSFDYRPPCTGLGWATNYSK
jgi:hypothetical protein